MAQRFLAGIGCLIFSAALGWTQPTVSNVRATPRAGTKFVDITYDLAHASGLACTIKVEVSQEPTSQPAKTDAPAAKEAR